MNAKKIYRIFINKKCTKCGICSSMFPEHFVEDFDGTVRIKNDTINEFEFESFEKVKQMCLSGAIQFKEIERRSKEEYEKEIHMLLNEELSKITLISVKKIDYQLCLKDIAVNISFPSEISEYKYNSYEIAEEKGIEALQKIFNENKATIMRGALIDHKVRKLDKFLDRNHPLYYFKAFEEQLNLLIYNINHLVEEGLNQPVSYPEFSVDLKKLNQFGILDSFDKSLPMAGWKTDYKYYVTVEYAKWNDKHRYELQDKDIYEMFNAMISDSFFEYYDGVLDKALEEYIQEYNQIAIEYIHTYVEYILKKVPAPIMGKLDKENQIKEKITILSENLKQSEQKCTEGNYIHLDVDYDSSLRFAFRSDARKAADNRTDRLLREIREYFEKYAETLAENYKNEMVSVIESYVGEVRKICIAGDKLVSNANLNIKLGEYREFSLSIQDVRLSNSAKTVLKDYVLSICKEIICNDLKSFIWISYDIESGEVYMGEGLFGRSKFVTKYGYNFDSIKVHQEVIEETVKLNDILQKKEVMKAVYRKVTKVVEKEVGK